MKQSATILLVEDDYSILDGMADLLRVFDLEYDIRVLKATNGEEGLAVMERETPDLIISDIMMPRMNGFEFLAKVRDNPAWVHIPFIFLTAKGKKEDILEGRRSGAELYITKPFVSEELLELVKTQLDRTFELQDARQKKLDNLKRNILQLLNHEFRTPLTYVTAYYEMLADSLVSLEDNAHLQEYLRGIQVGSQRLTRLVEDLITIMEIRTGEAAAVFEREARPVEQVDELLRQRARAQEARAAEQGVTFRYDIASDLPPVFGVPPLLGDALDRLLDNAVKFTAGRRNGPGEVHVRAAKRNDHVVLSVKDSGVGFPAHVRDQLFELFFQHNRELMEQQGSGAGLAIAKGLVDLHAGVIEAESEEGSGSRFSIVLPVYDPQQAGEAPWSSSGRQATLLIVEDDVHLLEGLRELLEFSDTAYDFTVLTAENGQEGLAVLERRQPDLIISDVMMPVMDGYEFLREVRKNPAWLQIPFIFLTARGERKDIHRGRRSGAEEYITKPYDIDELLDLTCTQLDRHFQRQGAVNQSFEALKRSILGMLQPDFKGPLHLVTDYSRQLAQKLESAETDEDLIASLQGIQASSERLSRLVEDFIAMAEFKTGEAETAFELQARPVDQVSMILYEAAYEKQYEAEQQGIRFNFNLEHDLPSVLCDRERLLQSLRRLIDVVLDCARKRGCSQLNLTSAAVGDEVHLSIRGDGPLFTQDEARRIARFLGQEGEEILDLPQTGPSITVVRNVVHLHGGRMVLELSGAQETTLRIALPVYEAERSS
ncbi:MAG: response regulator [Candidatus Promineifilaceae bacterium]|nr:response regulator [Candidatus Promineifilaceae bacterium]